MHKYRMFLITAELNEKNVLLLLISVMVFQIEPYQSITIFRNTDLTNASMSDPWTFIFLQILLRDVIISAYALITFSFYL